jgi:hypothetical protein
MQAQISTWLKQVVTPTLLVRSGQLLSQNVNLNGNG